MTELETLRRRRELVVLSAELQRATLVRRIDHVQRHPINTMVGLATSVEVALLALPATNVTPAVLVMAPTVAVTVLFSALVEARVAVKTPAALVVPEAGVKVLAEPELLSVTAWPLTGLPWASRTVVVRLVVLVPSAVSELGLAAKDDVVLLAAPGVNVTPVVTAAAPRVAVTVLASALVEARVAVKMPDAFVVPDAGANVLLEPVLLKLTVCPAMALPWASLAVTVRVVVLVPLAVRGVGLAVRVLVPLLAAPAT